MKLHRRFFAVWDCFLLALAVILILAVIPSAANAAARDGVQPIPVYGNDNVMGKASTPYPCPTDGQTKRSAPPPITPPVTASCRDEGAAMRSTAMVHREQAPPRQDLPTDDTGEPETLAMLAAGLALMGIVVWRRTREKN
ncbi:MAG: hypothetical protein EKK46_10135 [Rhodocyclaceae bacterium]|nr:MAG: hypothetical protein EKK46_10135 [Rhodocyclaceae bacterium]